MSYRHFGEYIQALSSFDERTALVIRPFIKIERTGYRNLVERAYQVAHYLQASHVAAGDRVVVVAANRPEWLTLFLGVQLVGATLVPIDVGSSEETVKRFVADVEPVLAFRSRHTHPELNTLVSTLELDELYGLIASYPSDKPLVSLGGDELAVIVFTSGTTADPKGVMLTQQNILANIVSIQEAIAIEPDWRLLSVLPLSHMYELTGSLAVLSRGAGIFYINRVTPLAIAKALQTYRITTILAIPQLLVLLLERIKRVAAERGQARALAMASSLAAYVPFTWRRLLFRGVHIQLGGALRLVVTGGAPIPYDVAIAWERMGVKMLQGYGLTETAPMLTINRLNQRRLDSPGLLVPGVALRIAKNGEIQAKGPSIFKGYWRNEAASKAVFTKDGWFKTGDIGQLQNSWLFIRGRLKFAIVLSSGLKVFPEDIEAVATKHPAFSALCIVGVKTPAGEAVTAVVTSDRSDQAIDQSISEINTRLESFQHITAWRRWPEADFPRTRLLKVDRRSVQVWANSKITEQDPKSQAAAAEKDDLIRLIRLTISKPAVSIEEPDRLSDLGLDSLRRLSLVSLIEEQLGISVAETDVTKTTTVERLRNLLKSGKPVSPPLLRPTWPYHPVVRWLGNGLRDSLARAIVHYWVKLTITGREHLQELHEPAIFIFNHVDNFDGPVVYEALPRRIRKHLSVAAADDVLNEHKVLAFVARFCFAGFNMARKEPYLPSLEYVGQMIDQGWSVVLSPEGRISPSGELEPFKAGIGLLAVDLGVPVVPIKTFGLRGTAPLHHNWPVRHSQATVQIGQPLRFGPHEDYDAVSRQLHDSLAALRLA